MLEMYIVNFASNELAHKVATFRMLEVSVMSITVQVFKIYAVFIWMMLWRCKYLERKVEPMAVNSTKNYVRPHNWCAKCQLHELSNIKFNHCVYRNHCQHSLLGLLCYYDDYC